MSSLPVEIPLVVSGVDLDDDATLEQIAVSLDDLLWAEREGVVTATVFVDGDPVRAALESAARIAASLAGASVSRVYPDLVTMTDIADRVGVTRQAVRKWVTGRPTLPFPPPYAVLDAGGKPVKLWRWADAQAWLFDAKAWRAEQVVTSAQAAVIDGHLTQRTWKQRGSWTDPRYTSAVVRTSLRAVPSVRVSRVLSSESA